jgi:hypothetical protein
LVSSFFSKAICCLSLDPYPTVNVTRYNSQSFTCIVDPSWSSVVYVYISTNIALHVAPGNCYDFIDQSSGLYKTGCNDSTRMFYLTINNVTDDYNGKTIQCRVFYTGTSPDKESLINVQCK